MSQRPGRAAFALACAAATALGYILALAVVLAPASTPLLADDTNRTITVRVHKTAGVPLSIESRALGSRNRTARSARRRRVATMHRDESFRRLRGTGGSVQLTLRIVRTGSAQEDASITLGAALINRQAGGVLATVYFTRVA